jgi:hypothetical protein
MHIAFFSGVGTYITKSFLRKEHYVKNHVINVLYYVVIYIFYDFPILLIESKFYLNQVYKSTFLQN